MKSLYSFLKLFCFLYLTANAGFSQIAKTNIVEHFTNTSCSVCANNNAGYYSTINSSSNTIHISFHPSSPYTSDFFNQQNMAENDARTNFYGVYGSTPRLVVNGLVISGSTLSTTLNAQSAATTNYSFEITQTTILADSFVVKAVITKLAADTTTNALLFLGVNEDTIVRTTNNGETVHYNVFRKTLTNIAGNAIALPTAVGDSFVLTVGYRASASWQLDQLRTVGVLQANNKAVINSAESNNNINTTAVFLIDAQVYENILFPNPSPDMVFWKAKLVSLQIYSELGAMLYQNKELEQINSVSIADLPKGIHIAKMTTKEGAVYLQKIIKQ